MHSVADIDFVMQFKTNLPMHKTKTSANLFRMLRYLYAYSHIVALSSDVHNYYILTFHFLQPQHKTLSSDVFSR